MLQCRQYTRDTPQPTDPVVTETFLGCVCVYVCVGEWFEHMTIFVVLAFMPGN